MFEEKLRALYLDWVNNYLTIEEMAFDNGLKPDEMLELIRIGGNCHLRFLEEVLP